MSWAKRLMGFSGTETLSASELQALLGPICSALSGLSAQVVAHAEMAPTAASDAELAALGQDLATQSERLATLLVEREAPRPAAAELNSVAQSSHWARLVQDLEELREIRRRLLDAYARVNEIEPALAAEIEDCGRRVEGFLHRMRAMIARADPQALD